MRTRSRILIENHTHWSSRELRRFVVRIAAFVLTDAYWGKHSCVTVRFAHFSGRGSACSGHAHLGGAFAHVDVPKKEVDRVDLAQTLAHEFGHLLGLTHRDMAGGSMWLAVGDWRERYAWANALPLSAKALRPRPTASDRREIRRLRLQGRLKKWEQRAKRAERAIAKLRRQLQRMKRREESSSAREANNAPHRK